MKRKSLVLLLAAVAFLAAVGLLGGRWYANKRVQEEAARLVAQMPPGLTASYRGLEYEVFGSSIHMDQLTLTWREPDSPAQAKLQLHDLTLVGPNLATLEALFPPPGGAPPAQQSFLPLFKRFHAARVELEPQAPNPVVKLDALSLEGLEVMVPPRACPPPGGLPPEARLEALFCWLETFRLQGMRLQAMEISNPANRVVLSLRALELTNLALPGALSLRLHGLELRDGDEGLAQVGSLELSDFELARLRSLANPQALAGLTPDRLLAMLVFRELGLAGVNFAVPRSPSLRLQGLTLRGYDGETLGEALLKGLSLQARDGEYLRLEDAGLTGLAPARLLSLLDGPIRDPDAFLMRPPRLSGLRLAGLEYGGPGGTLLSLGALSLSEVQLTDEIVSNLKVDMQGLEVRHAALAGAPLAKAMSDLGYRDLNLDLDLLWDYQPTARTLRGHIALAARQAGRLRLEVDLGNVNLHEKLKRHQRSRALDEVAVVGLALAYHDDSLWSRLLKKIAKEVRDTPEGLVNQAKSALRREVAKGGNPAGAKLAAGLEQFLNDPRSLTLRIKPPRPYRVGELDRLVFQGPDALIAALGLTVEANR